MALSKKTIYIGATAPLALIGLAGLVEVLFPAMAINILGRLGYPSYVVYILGVAKFLGGLAIVFGNKYPKLKEWAYAGFAFDLIGATISQGVTGHYPEAFSAGVLALFVFYSRVVWIDYSRTKGAEVERG